MPKERSLKELEDYLWTVFDGAKRDMNTYKNWDDSTQNHPGNYTIENRKAIAGLGQAIAALRRERRVEKLFESEQMIEEEMDAGLKSGVTPLSPIKLKQPGTP